MAGASGKNFTRWENNLQDNICAAKFTLYEVLFIWKLGRMTYGWRRNWMEWDRQPFIECGIPSNKVYFVRDSLISKGVVKQRSKGIGLERRGYKWEVEWKAEGYPKEVKPWSPQKIGLDSPIEEGKIGLHSPKEDSTVLSEIGLHSPKEDSTVLSEISSIGLHSPKNRTPQSYKEDSTVLSTGSKPGADANVQTPKDKKDNKDKNSGAFGTKDFWNFYNTYPRKINAKTSYSKWKEVVEDKSVSLEEVMQALDKYVRGEWRGWKKDKIPYPNTWLEREPWLDAAFDLVNVSGKDIEHWKEWKAKAERRVLEAAKDFGWDDERIDRELSTIEVQFNKKVKEIQNGKA